MESTDSAMQNGEVDLEANGNEDLSEMKELQDPSKPVRIISKAKRFHRSNSGGDAPSNGSSAAPLLAKNSRKSRDGRGRGVPKKGQV